MKLSKKSILIVSVAVLTMATTVTAWLVTHRKPDAPDFRNKKSEQIIEYLKSDEFKNLDQGARRNTGRQALRQIMTTHAKEYCRLPPENQSEYLDNAIDTMQSRRREFEAIRGDMRNRDRGSDRPEQRQFNSDTQDRRQRRGRGSGWRGRRRSPERMRARKEFVTPETRAQIRKFRQALRERMSRRGIDFRSRRR